MSAPNTLSVSPKDPAVQLWGRWNTDAAPKTQTAFSTCMLSFRGGHVLCRLNPGRGLADFYLDEVFQETLDCAGERLSFFRDGLEPGKLHFLRIVPRKQDGSREVLLEIAGFDVPEPVNSPEEMRLEMEAEYRQIRDLQKPVTPAESWKPVAFRAVSPKNGVRLLDGPMKDMYRANLNIVKYDFTLPDFCEGPDTGDGGAGWSHWLPASNHGRLLAGAAHALRWEEDPELREIVDTLVDEIESQMREDGYYNYYPESDSYALNATMQSLKPGDDWWPLQHSERKNYDRVFWTRGLIAASMAGNRKALPLARRMYDWLYRHEEYLKTMLLGGNATNGQPGGPLLYHTEVGRPEDIWLNQRFYNQEYWFRAMREGNPMAFSHYPGERPHCYELLQLEALADLYRATGSKTYLDTLLAGWKLYQECYLHAGGTSAICEGAQLYPPRSRLIYGVGTGETCGSVFWIWINQRLAQLFPEEEAYACEIEKSLFNVILACRTKDGLTRYMNHMQGPHGGADNNNSCCQVSSTMLISAMPELIYSRAPGCVYVNLPIASEYRGGGLALKLETGFPVSGDLTLTVLEDPTEETALKLRIPGWAEGPVQVRLSDGTEETGIPGTYLTLNRRWKQGDRISMTVPMKLWAEKYTGLEQAENGLDRYALFFGPVLLAVTGDFDPVNVPCLAFSPEQLAEKLIPAGPDLTYSVAGQPELTVRPYYDAREDGFTCYPILGG